MKIVFLSDDFPPASFGGAGISTYELALGMKKIGHEISVITTCRKDIEAGEFEYHGIKVYKIASNYNDRWRAYVSLYNRPVVRKIEELLRQIQPDVTHANNIHFYLSYHCLKVARKYSKVVIFTARDVMAFNFAKLETKQYLDNLDCRTTWRDHIKQAGKRYNPLRNFCIRRYLGYADRVFAISKSLQEALLQNGIKNVGMIYNGIDASGWDVNVGTTTHFKVKYGLQNKKVLLFGGRLSAAKGGEKTIEALAQITRKMPDVVLLVAGNVDEYAEVMRGEAKKMGVEQNLIFTGWIGGEDVKTAYAASDVVLMPSICLDAFGRVNIEAMVARKPVVGTCYGGTPEIVVDGVTGYIVNPLHPEEIAEKALDLLKNPEKAQKFGRAGYERAIVNFNLEDRVQEHIAVYTELLKKSQ